MGGLCLHFRPCKFRFNTAFSALCAQSIVHAPSTPPPIHTQTLARWSRGNSCSLCSLLEELLSEYKSHHRLIVEQQQRLKFELSTLEGGDCFSNVDVHCTKPSDKVRGSTYIIIIILFIVAAMFRTSDKVLYSSLSGFFYHTSLPDKGKPPLTPHPSPLTPHTSPPPPTPHTSPPHLLCTGAHYRTTLGMMRLLC